MAGRDRRDRRWPRASDAPADDDIDAAIKPPLGVKPLTVPEPAKPSRVFMALVGALGLPASIVRFLVQDVLDDPRARPETMTASQLLLLGPTLLRTIHEFLPDDERDAAHKRVEALLEKTAK